MDRKGRLLCTVLICRLLVCCSDLDSRTEVEIRICEPAAVTKAEMPDETRISDITVIIFDSNGGLELCTFLYDGSPLRTTLLKGSRYSIYAFVNFGYKVKAQSLEELRELEFHLAYPDEYRTGIPMYAMTEVTIGKEPHIELEPVRLMSKISIRIDRSRLSEGIRMDAAAVQIGNCPRKVRIFGNSRAENEDECFVTGFRHSGQECSPLNRENGERVSEELSLYMLENMQGRFSEKDILRDEEKVLAEYDKRRLTCSYIEMDMNYSSPLWSSGSSPLRYRFYLGNSLNDLNVERNCHYHITICPEGDGLEGCGWRTDKTGLKYTGETSLEKYPSDYIRGNIGEKIHLGCILTPSSAPFDIGLEYLEDDKAEGIYDYVIDQDGHGVTLTLTGPGRGLIYMEAGDPINEAALFIVEVNLPD